MTNQAILDAFAEQRQTRAIEAAARREGYKVQIMTAFELVTQPMTSDEVAFVTGIERSTANKVLGDMVKEGQIASRVETPDERMTRFGTQARASKARLFSTVSPVPERTERVAVPGYVAETAKELHPLSTAEVERRLGCYFKKKGKTSTFTPGDVSDVTQIPIGTVQHRLRRMRKDGVIFKTGKAREGAQMHKITSKDAVLMYFKLDDQPLPEPATQLSAVPDPTPSLPSPTPAIIKTVTVPLAELRELKDELIALKRENEELKANASSSDVQSLAEVLAAL